MTSPVSTPPLRDVTSVNAAPYVTPPVCTWPHIRDTCVCGINIAWLFGEQERHKYRMSPQCGVLQAGVCRVSHVLHGSGSVVCVKYCVLNTSTDAACSGRVRQILHPPHVKYSVQSVLQALCVCVCVCVCVCACQILRLVPATSVKRTWASLYTSTDAGRFRPGFRCTHHVSHLRTYLLQDEAGGSRRFFLRVTQSLVPAS